MFDAFHHWDKPWSSLLPVAGHPLVNIKDKINYHLEIVIRVLLKKDCVGLARLFSLRNTRIDNERAMNIGYKDETGLKKYRASFFFGT